MLLIAKDIVKRPIESLALSSRHILHLPPHTLNVIIRFRSEHTEYEREVTNGWVRLSVPKEFRHHH